jgi:hypothetical protein
VPAPRTACRYRASIGINAGVIIAIIMTVHMPRNDAAAANQD